jgi:hypothetical protein
MEWWNDGSKTVIQYSNIPTLRLLVTSYILRAELTSAGGEAVKFYSLNHGWLFWESRWIASWHAQKTHHRIARPVLGEQYLNHHNATNGNK